MKITLAVAGLLAGAWSAGATAQQTGESCATIVAASERLACYDGVFRPGVAPIPVGEALVIQSEQLIPARPNGRDNARLTVACENGTLQVYFAFAGQQMSATGSNGLITFQFDQGPPGVRNLPVSPDNTQIGFWTTAESQAFLAQFQGADGLRVRVTPANFRSLAVDFRLAAHQAAVAALSETCR